MINMTQNENNKKLNEMDLLNRAAFCAFLLSKAKNTKSSQVNLLLEVLSQKEGRNGILLVQEHLIYQSGKRGTLPEKFSKQVFNDLLDILNEVKDNTEAEQLAREYLLHIKRLYTGIEGLIRGGVTIDSVEGAFFKLAKAALNAPRNDRGGQGQSHQDKQRKYRRR